MKAMKAAYPDGYPFSDRCSKPPTRRENLLGILGTAYGTHGGLGLPARHLGPGGEQVRLHRRDRPVQADVTVPAQAGQRGAAGPGELHPDRRPGPAEVRQRQVVRDQRQRADAGQQHRKDMAKIPNATMAKIPLPIGPAGRDQPGPPAGERHHDLHEGPGEQELRGHDAVHRLALVLRRRPGVRQMGDQGHDLHRRRRRRQLQAHPRGRLGRAQPPGTKHLQVDFGFFNGVFAYGGSTEAGQSHVLRRGEGVPGGDGRAASRARSPRRTRSPTRNASR